MKILLLIFCLLPAPVFSQDAETVPRLTNKEVLEMVKAELSPEIIVSKIKRSRCNFNTDPGILSELKYKGVPDEVLKAMVEAPYGRPQIVPAPEPQIKENNTEAGPTPEAVKQAEPAPDVNLQSDKPMPDRWRGLVIGKATPDDAVKVLGRPTKDRQSSPRTYPLNKRVRIDHNTEGVRQLFYEKLEGVTKAYLYFKDGRLIVIDLELKPGIPASTFPNLYDLEFWPKVSNMQLTMEPGEYERNEGRIYPKNYPVVYYLIASTEKTYVSAWVDNGGFGGMFLGSKRTKMGDDDKGGFPGKVERVQIISRHIEKSVGSRALNE